MTPWEHMLSGLVYVEMETAAPNDKTCTRCHQTLPLTEFYRNEHKIVSRCKTCYKAQVKQRKEKLNEASRQTSRLSA